MKNILKIMAFLLTMVWFAGCHEITTEGVTSVTHYPSFKLLGDEIFTIALGETFIDPGVIVMEGDNDISDKVIVTGTVNTGEVGFYPLTYSATNVDGFSGSAPRLVFVYDPSITTDISGSYTVDLPQSNRFQFSNSAVIEYANLGALYGGDFSKFTVDLEQIAPGIFSVNDLYGGYYYAGRNYSAIYMMGGYIALNGDNSIDVLYSLVPGWGDALDDLSDASYDPATETIEWGAEYAGSYSFNVVLNKK